jgi:hypothetical protein
MEELLEDVKNFLDITWEMELGEKKKLSGIIERGKAYLKGKIGQCNFEEETPEKDLLLNYCMYARAGQVDEFVKNYKQEIIALQIHNWRKKNAET